MEHQDPPDVRRGDIKQAMEIAARLRNCWSIEEDGGGETPVLVEVGALPPEGDPRREGWDISLWSWQVHAGCGDCCPIMAEVPYDFDSDGPHREIAEAIAMAGEVIWGLVERVRALEAEVAALKAPQPATPAQPGTLEALREAALSDGLDWGVRVYDAALAWAEEGCPGYETEPAAEAPVMAPEWLEEPTKEDAPRVAAVRALTTRIMAAVKTGDRAALDAAEAALARLCGEALECSVCGGDVEPTDAPSCPVCDAPNWHALIDALPDPVAAAERVVGGEWVTDTIFAGDWALACAGGVLAWSSPASGWTVWSGAWGDVDTIAEGDGDDRSRASRDLLHLIADGKVTLPPGAPGLGALKESP